MRSSLRAGDSIYRVGGEEILVVLPGATEDRCGRSRRAPATRGAGSPPGRRLGDDQRRRRRLPPGPLDADELVGLADSALYSAKADGRDRVVVGAN